MVKVLIYNDENYAGMQGVKWPALVNARVQEINGEVVAIVPETELMKIGAVAYQPDEFYQPSNNHGLPFREFRRVY